jgi:hypothetical protein
MEVDAERVLEVDFVGVEEVDCEWVEVVDVILEVENVDCETVTVEVDFVLERTVDELTGNLIVVEEIVEDWPDFEEVEVNDELDLDFEELEMETEELVVTLVVDWEVEVVDRELLDFEELDNDNELEVGLDAFKLVLVVDAIEIVLDNVAEEDEILWVLVFVLDKDFKVVEDGLVVEEVLGEDILMVGREEVDVDVVRCFLAKTACTWVCK